MAAASGFGTGARWAFRVPSLASRMPSLIGIGVLPGCVGSSVCGLRRLPCTLSLLRRLVTLISQQAVLGASSEAFRKQAEGASQAARRYMEDNDALRKQLQEAGGEASPSHDENETLKAKVEKLKEELAASKRTLEKAENEVQAMRRQAEGLTREYDRLLDQHAPPAALGGGGRAGA
ncbi:B-cell receptor-associated protein 31 [Leptosomus discolor]